MPQRVFRMLVSAPPFAEAEWTELDQVFDGINQRLCGLARLEKITSLTANVALDAIIVLLRPRLADDPSDAHLTRGKAASLSEAVDRRQPGVGLPDIFIFNYAEPASLADGESGWETRKLGFRSWFEAKGGDYLALETYASRTAFTALAERLLWTWLDRAGVAPPLPTPAPELISELEIFATTPDAMAETPEERAPAAPWIGMRSLFRRKGQAVATESELPMVGATEQPAADPLPDLFAMAPAQPVDQTPTPEEQGVLSEDPSSKGVERHAQAETFIEDAEPSPPPDETVTSVAQIDDEAAQSHMPAAMLDEAAPEEADVGEPPAAFAEHPDMAFLADETAPSEEPPPVDPVVDESLPVRDDDEATPGDAGVGEPPPAFAQYSETEFSTDETAPQEDQPPIQSIVDPSLSLQVEDETKLPDADTEIDPADIVAGTQDGSFHEIPFANDAVSAPLPDDLSGLQYVASEDAAAEALNAHPDNFLNENGEYIPAPVERGQTLHDPPNGEEPPDYDAAFEPVALVAEEDLPAAVIPPSGDRGSIVGDHGVATPPSSWRRVAFAMVGVGVLGIALLLFFAWRWHVATVQRDEAARQAAEAAAKASDLVFQLSKKPEKSGPPPDAEAIREKAEQLQNLLLEAAGTTPAERRAQAEAFLLSVNDLIKNNKLEDAATAALKARQIFQSLALAEPANRDLREGLFAANMKLGDVLAAQGHFDDAVTVYGSASIISAALAPAIGNEANRARRLIAGDYAMGNALLNHGRRDQAIAAFQADIAIARQMAARNGADSSWRLDIALGQEAIGKALIGQDHFDEAVAAYREALAIRKALPKDGGNPATRADLAETVQKLGDLAVVQGRGDEGLADYREALALWKAIVQQEPGNADYQANLAESHNNLGDVLAARGKMDEAISAYGEGTAIAMTMAGKSPNDVKWRRMMAISDVKMGDVLLARKRTDEALTAYKDALSVLNALVQSQPQSVEWKGLLSADNERVGDLFAAEGHFESALAAYHDELALLQDLSRAAPDNASWRHALSECELRMGAVLFEQGHLAEAITAHRESLGIVKAMVQTEPSDPHLQRDLLMDDSKMGQLLMTQGSRPEALAAYRDGLEVVKRLLASQQDDLDLESTQSMIDSNIGAILMSEGRRDEALVAYRDGYEAAKKRADADPRNSESQTSLVIAYYNLAEAGDKSAANFSAALSILKQLEAAGALTKENYPLIAKVEAKLAALKRHAPID